MQHIKLSIEKAFGFVSEQAVANYKTQVTNANAALHNGTGKGSDFLGWLNLPTSIDEAHLTDVENTAKILRENCEIVVVIGIGGSYLGAKAVIDALSNSVDWLQTERTSPAVVVPRVSGPGGSECTQSSGCRPRWRDTACPDDRCRVARGQSRCSRCGSRQPDSCWYPDPS